LSPYTTLFRSLNRESALITADRGDRPASQDYFSRAFLVQPRFADTKRQLDGPADVDAVRRLEQRCRELAVDVVVVERRRRPVRERVALANLVVLEAAERVVD